ncbi:MAG TPA: MraY family glycosyltransferase [Tepidisphaeraceae bacterium]|jgi:UDP-GlcNAc:undecaprenyl-phosphate GlcNAc-1-phosphate transferase|nr:MraY family glycosyltransferase [Tepidisphaeraceae bacterium]
MFIAVTESTSVRSLTWDSVLSPHVYVFCAAWLVSFIFTPIMQAIANFYGIIDQPDRVRKLHATPVAYLGGVAVFMGWLAGLATSQLHLPQDEIGAPHLQVKLNIVFGALLIVLLGLWDDVKRIPPRNKILGQVIAAIILLKGGVGSHCLDPLFQPINIRLQNALGPHFFFPDPLVAVLSWSFVVAMVVGCCNATNLLDGLDGLCGGVSAVIGAGFLFLAVHLAMLGLEPDWDAVRIVLALAMLGAIVGFVPYNFNPASIFLGDTGSMFIGYSCATIIVLLAQEQSKWLLAALVMFALPILDTALAFARRWVNRRPLFSADRHHFHHQLVERGFSIRQTVLISYGLAFAFGILGMMVAYIRTRYAISFYLVIFGSIIVAAYKMGLVHEKTRVVTPKSLGSTDAMMPVTGGRQSGAVLELRDAGNTIDEANISVRAEMPSADQPAGE